MRIHNRSIPNHGGFSLIEAMIAVLVLAVGLLALVALQANLVRESADAKARSRIASLVSSRMDAARAGGYISISTQPALTCSAGNEICAAQDDAAVSGLSVTQNVVTTPTPPAMGANDSQYKTLTVTASWTDSAARTRSLSMNTIISPLSLDTSGTLLNQQLAGDVAKTPVVRTSDPATDGVIPIALGDGSSSAASNPTPELIGKNKNAEIVGTRFNVLNYVPSGGGAVIQRRTETAVIKCSCEFGPLGNDVGEIYKAPQWPAIWTGVRYDLYRPESGPAPGTVTPARPVANANQSPLCLECCRDHHDTAASNVAKFDPERPAESAGKFNLINGVLGPKPVTGGKFVNACRIVRVDGLWRTAADMYLRQMGLLETQDSARSGLPTTAATSEYQRFVKDFLGRYTGNSGTPPEDADTIFNDEATYALNLPELISIPKPSTTDYRYLHARALYVDYLETAARKKVKEAFDGCPSDKSKADCVMPYLPFTSANLTEIAGWAASNSSVLIVNSGNLLATNPAQPSGGRSFGRASGESENIVTTGRSNAGIAVSEALRSVIGVDPSDWDTQAEDRQAFRVEGDAGTQTGDQFSVKIVGGGSNPYVHYVIGTDTDECLKPKNGNHACVTNSTLPTSVTVRVSRYWGVGHDDKEVSCTVGANTAKTVMQWPKLINYRVASTSPASASTAQVGTDGGTNEETLVTFSTLPKDQLVTVNLQVEASLVFATVKSCTLNGGNNKVQSVIWNEEWAN